MENKPSKEQVARFEKIKEDFINSPLFKNIQRVAKEYNAQIERIQKILAPSLEQINNLKKFYAPTSGGKPATIRIKFNNKIYIVRVNKVIGKYIVIAAQKVALTQIRGRYRYVT